MAKKQKRRTISISPSMYQRLKDYCVTTGTPMSALVEKLVSAELHIPAPDVAGQRSASGKLGCQVRWAGHVRTTPTPPSPEVQQRKREAREAARMTKSEVDRALALERARLLRPAQAIAPLQLAPPPCCAICTDEIRGDHTREPLGKAGALVIVCSDCSSTAADPQGALRIKAGYEPRWTRKAG